MKKTITTILIGLAALATKSQDLVPFKNKNNKYGLKNKLEKF